MSTFMVVTGVDISGNNIGDYVPIPDVSLLITPGSPLDFSSLLDWSSGAAGNRGRIIIHNGQFVFADEPDTRAKLSCGILLSSANGGVPDKYQADLYAQQFKLHGYNFIRGSQEGWLMYKRTKDYDFNPVQLDRWWYWLSALKREGLYYMIECLSSDNGGLWSPNSYANTHNLRFRLYWDPSAVQIWKDFVNALYIPINPYTNTSPLLDDACGGAILVNEGGLMTLTMVQANGIWPQELQPGFAKYVRDKYETTAALILAWNVPSSDPWQPTETLLNLTTIRLPLQLNSQAPRQIDFMRYVTQLEIDLVRWQTAYLRSLGYSGPISSLDNWPSTQADSSRSKLDWIDMHSYDHEVTSFGIGATIDQTSSLDDFAHYTRFMAITRQAGKPFSVSEWGQPFWNRYRFEAGPVAYGMAAFQSFDLFCQHAYTTIDLGFYETEGRKTHLEAYTLGLDPITRATETLGALLYIRQDVSPAQHRISIDYENNDSAASLSPCDPTPDSISNLAWVTGMEARFPGEKTNVPPNIPILNLLPNETSAQLRTRYALPFTYQEQYRSNYIAQGTSLRLDQLRCSSTLSMATSCATQQILDDTNISDGIRFLQTDTKELLVDSYLLRFYVNTPRTIALTTAAPIKRPGVTQGCMTIEWMTTPGLISASNLDANYSPSQQVSSGGAIGPSLTDSHRILFIFATDAENTNMTFSDGPNGRTTISNVGTMPTRLMRSTVRITINLSHTLPMRLYALSLNGDPSLPVTGLVRHRSIIGTTSGTSWSFVLDTTQPIVTTYFILEAVN